MIKFHCLNCGQKLACSEDGVGAVVSCTNCLERIVVPPYSVSQAYPTEPASGRSAPPAMNGSVPATIREALIPHLARMMMNRLVQALIGQRTNLIDTQLEATKRMAELEERIAKAQVNVQTRFAAYENRIAELERMLLTVEEEKRELMRQNFQLAKRALEAENAPQTARINLSDAGFLLRA